MPPSFYQHLIRSFFIFLIQGYQKWISPLLGNHCRFYPTCSEYCLEAIKAHGALKGGWLGFIRIIKCGPWHPGGIDSIPLKKTSREDPFKHSSNLDN